MFFSTSEHVAASGRRRYRNARDEVRLPSISISVRPQRRCRERERERESERFEERLGHYSARDWHVETAIVDWTTLRGRGTAESASRRRQRTMARPGRGNGNAVREKKKGNPQKKKAQRNDVRTARHSITTVTRWRNKSAGGPSGFLLSSCQLQTENPMKMNKNRNRIDNKSNSD